MPRSASKRKHHTKSKKIRRRKSRLLDYAVSAAVVIAPISLLPQLFMVWRDGDSSGVSITTWLTTLLITLPLIVYDLTYRAQKLVFMHVSIVLISFGIVLGLLIE